MWQLKMSVIPVVVDALGLVKKGTSKHLEKIPCKENLAKVQKKVLTSPTHMLRKAL